MSKQRDKDSILVILQIGLHFVLFIHFHLKKHNKDQKISGKLCGQFEIHNIKKLHTFYF